MLELKIAKPCDQTWTAMKGDERVRHCARCQRSVYNISEMTEEEVEDLIRRTEGRFCARIYRRTDNRVMTRDCPKGVAAVRRRGVLALAVAGASMTYAFSLSNRSTKVSIPRCTGPKPRVTPYKASEPSMAESNELHLELGQVSFTPGRGRTGTKSTLGDRPHPDR